MRDENYKEEKVPLEAYIHNWDDIIEGNYSPNDTVYLLADGRFTIRDDNGQLVQSSVYDATKYCERTGKGWEALHKISPSFGELSQRELDLALNTSVY